jgi:hypothetical protein
VSSTMHPPSDRWRACITALATAGVLALAALAAPAHVGTGDRGPDGLRHEREK